MKNFVQIKESQSSSPQNLSSDSDSDSTISKKSRSPINRKSSNVDDSEIKQNRKKCSIVWKYFKKINRNLAKCIICRRTYKVSGNTSNLLDHLKRFHPVIENENKDSDATSTCSNRSISPFFKRKVYYDNLSQRKKQLDRALVKMVATDFQPFTIVNDTGFQEFVNLLDPRYKLPSTYTLSEKLLQEAYLEAYNKLKTDLNKIDYVGITCDSWTSIANESYLTVTCHYVDENFLLKSCVLSTKPLSNGINHTSENISQHLKDVFSEWHINDKVSSIVTDNAANMIKACDLIQKRHLPCYAHTLNLVVQDNIKFVGDVIKKAKGIVTFFKSSPLAMETFKNEQKIKAEDQPLKLIQEVPTRWNSTFYMIERIIETNDALGRALLKLRKAPQPLSVDNITLLVDIKKVLSCFEEATKKISGNSYVTVSLIIPITFGIQSFLKQTLPQLLTEEGKTFCNNLLISVNERLAPYETRSLTRLGTILDPRFKKEGFRNQENASAAAKILEQEMLTLSHRIQENEISTNYTESEKSSITSTCLFGFLKERINEKVKSATADVIIIKRQYLERHNMAENTDPLLFWKETKNEFTPLEELSRKYLCVPATSVESERIFSSTGQLVSDRRSRLKPNNVNMLTFLHKNFNFLSQK